MNTSKDLHLIRRWITFFIVALLISGLTAVPLVWLTGLLAAWTAPFGGALAEWAAHAAEAVAHVAEAYPILLYGTDWLAFAHVVIALLFIGPWRDPVRNRWVVEWGLWCCALVVLVAFAWAPVRDIPFFWRCVDASFGVIGAVPLYIVLRAIDRMAARSHAHP
ncbi:MAG: hypothetical protein IPN62_06665 [Flavobacteriales bacterium]|nr:hypothetical protein [Flavobacteriales bacterium]